MSFKEELCDLKPGGRLCVQEVVNTFYASTMTGARWQNEDVRNGNFGAEKPGGRFALEEKRRGYSSANGGFTLCILQDEIMLGA